MFYRRFIPYLIAICIFVFFYIGYRTYQRDVEFKEFMSDAKMFQWSLDKDSPPQQYEYAENFRMDELTPQEVTGPDGETYRAIVPPGMDVETLQTGGYAIEFSRDQMVTQLVETPDGEIHEIIVPRGFELQPGAAVSRAALDSPLVSFTTRIDGKKHVSPEGEDVHVYGKKLLWAHELKISMEEVERKIAAGEIDISFSEQEKMDIEEERKFREEILRGIPTEKPPLSDKSPVKVRFMTDEQMRDDRSYSTPGRAQHLADLHQHPHNGESEHSPRSGEHSADALVSSESIDERTKTAPVSSDVPVSPSDLPDMVKTMPSPESMVDIKKNMTPAGIEAELSEGLSADSFDKAQQLIDRYGTEEGLRRLREMDPEAARRFESDPDSIEDAENRHKLRSQRVGTGREQRNPPTHDTSDDAASTQ